MPYLGLGVYNSKVGFEAEQAITSALECGYRLIDTASFYGNEESVGKAVRECQIPRNEIFITTKVWNDDLGYDATLRAFDLSMQKLGLDILDLYLIHWPYKNKFADAWKALEKLYAEGRIRAIGVSNFYDFHLEEIIANSNIVPAVNQIQFHPYYNRQALVDYCANKGIQIQAWSPLMQGRELMDEPVLIKIASNYNKSVAQIILRWNLQKGIATIPKSSNPERIKQNSRIFDFELSTKDIDLIDALNCGKFVGPDTLEFCK